VGGDTLWTCPLECDEFCHSAFVTAAEGGGWLASIHPDCCGDCAPVYRISGSGGSVFSTLLHHHSLLGLPETEGEIAPSVQSQEVTSSDDVLLTGQVHEWMTTPGAWFVCLLDGATGELLWTATGFGAGDAEIADAIELPDGRILAAGSTRDWDESSAARYGSPHPFLVLLEPSGKALDSLILADSPGGFHTLIAHPAGGDRFLVAHCVGDGEDLALLEMALPADRDSWSAPGQGRTPEEEVRWLVGMMGALDEDVIAAMMTPDEIAEVEVLLVMLRASPEGSAEILSSMGLDFTPEVIRTMSTETFLMRVFSSMEWEVGEALVAGDVAIVPVTTLGIGLLVPLVLEDGVWVLQEF